MFFMARSLIDTYLKATENIRGQLDRFITFLYACFRVVKLQDVWNILNSTTTNHQHAQKQKRTSLLATTEKAPEDSESAKANEGRR